MNLHHSAGYLSALRMVRDYSKPNAFNRDHEPRERVAEMVCGGKFHALLASELDFWRENELDDTVHKDHFDVLRQLNTIIWNNTDLSKALCELVSNSIILRSFVKYLDYSTCTKEGEISLKTPYIVKGILAILHRSKIFELRRFVQKSRTTLDGVALFIFLNVQKMTRHY